MLLHFIWWRTNVVLYLWQEGMSQQSVTRVRRFQRELEAAEDRADVAESNLTLIRAKHRTFVTTSTVPGSQVYLVQESRALSSEWEPYPRPAKHFFPPVDIGAQIPVGYKPSRSLSDVR